MQTDVFRIAFALFAGHLLVFSAAAQSKIPPAKSNAGLNAIRAEINKKVAENSIPSISIGVMRSGKVFWKESFGLADVEKKRAATPETVYALGSLSKSITGTAVFMLWQDGRIDLEKPIGKYLRTQTINYHDRNPDDYKVYHLLNMASGIPHYWRYCYANAGDLDKCGNELLGQASFSAFAPGEIHLYSNLSFGLAARMAADVSGKPFADYLRTRILKPSGMKSTYTHLAEIPKSRATVAKPYKRDGSPADEFQFEPAGGGGFYSTVNDLLKYGAIHLNRRNDRRAILSNSTLAENHRVRPELPHGYYANGWGVLPLPDNGTTLLSNGAIEGAASTLLVLPEADMVIVVLVNKTVGNDFTDDIAFRIAGAMLTGYKKNLDTLFEQVGPLFSGSDFAGDDTLNGRWNGSAIINDKPVSLELEFDRSDVRIRLNGNETKRLENIRVERKLIIGEASSPLGFGLLPPKEHKLTIQLRKSGARITGTIHTEIFDPRPEFLLAYYFSLSNESLK